tara:strand:- start:754 stop:981 length:228 start_codon:yes stop_codon:yes gene_type:complete
LFDLSPQGLHERIGASDIYESSAETGVLQPSWQQTEANRVWKQVMQLYQDDLAGEWPTIEEISTYMNLIGKFTLS